MCTAGGQRTENNGSLIDGLPKNSAGKGGVDVNSAGSLIQAL